MSRFRGSISGQVLRGRGTFGALAPTRKINNSSMVQPMNIREAYGGAITFSLPVSFADVSDVVPVPDNQEVFGDQEGRCLVVEILEAVSDVADQEATRFFWDNLVQENEASRNVVQSWGELSLADVPGVPPGSYKGVVEGVQSVAKGRQGHSEAKEVRICLAVVRLPEVSSELLLTFNCPAEVVSADSGHPQGEVLREVLRTLEIRNWDLFGV